MSKMNSQRIYRICIINVELMSTRKNNRCKKFQSNLNFLKSSNLIAVCIVYCYTIYAGANSATFSQQWNNKYTQTTHYLIAGRSLLMQSCESTEWPVPFGSINYRGRFSIQDVLNIQTIKLHLISLYQFEVNFSFKKLFRAIHFKS